MSRYTLISTGKIIANVFRNFRPTNNGWSVDAIEWIGEALGEMKVSSGYVKQSKTVNVVDYRYKMPSCLQALLGVEYKCCRLPYKGSLKIYKEEFRETCPLPAYPTDHYTLNPGCIHTSFETGEITIHYKTIPTDCNGYPMIINEQLLVKALEWYVMYCYLLRGGTHPVLSFGDAEQRWEQYKVRAKNSIKMPTPEKAWTFKDHWVSLVPNINREVDFFTDSFNVADVENSDISQFTGTSINPNL